MQNQQNALSDEPENRPAGVISRFHLPDDWTGKGACPVCRTPGRLSVQHQDVTPDRMVCGACGTAFEVETAGTRIRLAAAPPTLADRTAGLLNAWLTPAELSLLIEQATPLPPSSPFEPVPATPVPGEAPPSRPPATSNPEKIPTAPLSPKAARPAEAELEPGTEDWFASLAAVIGGQSPIKPPPNAVLADELERALLNRPENGADGAAPAPAPVVLVGDDTLSAVPEPSAEPQPLPPPAATEPLKPAAPKSADVVLAEAIAELAAANAPAAPVTAVVDPPVTLPATALPPTAIAPTAEPPVSAPPASAAVSAPAVTAAGAGETVSKLPATAATALVPAGVTAAAAPLAAAIPVTPSRRELAERAWRLHELGNSLASIQGALESSGGTPDDIHVIMAKLIALEQARRERHHRTVRRGLIAAASIVFILLVVAIVLGSLRPAVAPAIPATVGVSVSPGVGTPGPASTGQGSTAAISATAPATLVYNPFVAFLNQLLPGDVKIANGPSPTPAPTSAVLGALFPATATLSPAERATAAVKDNGLPSWVATLVPNGITIINVPTPSIEASGPPNSPCPATADQASALFGGPAGSWSYNRDQQGWIFILADKPAIIRIPANMSAGYLVIGDSLELRSEPGPVTLHNVNFVAVSCQ